jgi:hypothetical protein
VPSFRIALHREPEYQDWPDSKLLRTWGPLVPVTVRGRRDDDEPSAESIAGMALVDTGASSSAISTEVAECLNLRVIREHTDQRNDVCRIHPVMFTFDDKLTIRLEAIGYTLAPYVIALIGRDLLRLCVLVYDGYSGSATLEMAPGSPPPS